METPVMKCVVALYKEFDKYFGKDSGISKDKQVAAFVEANLAGWQKNPSDADAAKEVTEKIKVLEKEGVDKQKYTELLCLLLKLFSEKKLGVKQNP